MPRTGFDKLILGRTGRPIGPQIPGDYGKPARRARVPQPSFFYTFAPNGWMSSVCAVTRDSRYDKDRDTFNRRSTTYSTARSPYLQTRSGAAFLVRHGVPLEAGWSANSRKSSRSRSASKSWPLRRRARFSALLKKPAACDRFRNSIARLA